MKPKHFILWNIIWICMLISCKEKTITTVDIENQNQIIDSTLFYQQLKNYRTVGQWQYCGLAFSKKNNTPWTGYPHLYRSVGNDRLNLVIQQLDTVNQVKTGEISISNISQLKLGYNYLTSSDIRCKFTELAQDGCSPLGIYKLKDSTDEDSFFYLDKVDSNKNIISGRFRLNFVLGNSAPQYSAHLTSNVFFLDGWLYAKLIE